MRERYILLVSGLSGAGRTTALKSLEDIGFECIDNMPLRLVPALISQPETLPPQLALGVDVRNHDISTHVNEAIAAIRAVSGTRSHILFLTADADVLVRRFSETRRRHPLSPQRPVAESIALEEQVLADLRAQADTNLDTTHFKPADLQRYMHAQFSGGETQPMAVFLQSFGFKHGLPKEADFVFDMRFLRNPHWEPKLKPLTGLDKAVQDYVRADEAFAPTLQKMVDLLRFQLPLFAKNNKPYVTVAIGCTGGQHRSVTMTETLAKALADLPYTVKAHHRDIPLSINVEKQTG